MGYSLRRHSDTRPRGPDDMRAGQHRASHLSEYNKSCLGWDLCDRRRLLARRLHLLHHERRIFCEQEVRNCLKGHDVCNSIPQPSIRRPRRGEFSGRFTTTAPSRTLGKPATQEQDHARDPGSVTRTSGHGRSTAGSPSNSKTLATMSAHGASLSSQLSTNQWPAPVVRESIVACPLKSAARVVSLANIVFFGRRSDTASDHTLVRGWGPVCRQGL